MTVQRQYTLPNCHLKLEGLSTGDETDPMSPLTVVLNTEFTFTGVSDTFSGGREFLDALIETVSNYAQSLLSGVPYPMAVATSDGVPVTLIPRDNHRHQLIANVSDAQGQITQKSVDLTTVQLFDLVEAVDQLLADSLTLPDMTLQLSPLHRRHARPAEPAAKRVFPAAAGISALAASAALLFMVPVPEFEPQRSEEDNAAALVEEDAAEPSESDVPTLTDTDTDAIEVEPPVTDSVSAAAALSRLQSAPEVTDAETLAQLEDDLEDSLGDSLPDEIPFEDTLIYRVAVSESGDVLGYKYENDAALSNVESTPLPELIFIPVDADEAAEEPVALFRVTFDPDGEVTAEPVASSEDE